MQHTVGVGAQRIYPDVRNRPPNFGHPPRPIPGSIADLDRILKHCDYDAGKVCVAHRYFVVETCLICALKYIRDCHEFLRLGAGLDDAARLRREPLDDLRYIYVLDGEGDHVHARSQPTAPHANTTLKVRTTDNWERELTLPPPKHYNADNRGGSACREDDPRIFHMFWSGPFTDKPYMAMMAFLFTQNLGLNLDDPASEPNICRPQLWLWTSNRPADAMPGPNAHEEMLEELRANPWASPFLHPRFKDVIQFRLWNTTEQLDSIPELKDDWRSLGKDFLRSEGKTKQPNADKKLGSSIALDGSAKETHESYNKVPVVLSDLVRFVLCHRFGGVYLDVDMLFLRDWEELWGWSGSFSYRWSHEDRYNTAVLRLRRGSALGTFLIRTALAHGLDFHPTTISHYLKNSHMSHLLYRIPDALFDPGWQTCDYIKHWFSTEYLQRDRPPQPFFTE